MKITTGVALFLLGAAGAWAQKDAKDLYLDKCSVCHGPDGMAKTAKGKKLKMKDVHQVKMSEDEMIKIVADGKGTDMDSFGKDLSKEQIKGVVEYYRSLGN
jgi:mono/diheme cytochrome c family protein